MKHFLLLAIAAFTPAQEVTDSQILAMGHQRWIAKAKEATPGNLDELSAAEHRFALALGKRNNVRINQSPNKKKLEQLQMWVANLTKGAARVGDYAHANESLRFFHNRRANTLANLTIEGFMTQTPPPIILTQAQVWETYAKGKAFHDGNDEKIEAFRHSGQGGYTVKQLKLEYQSLGFFIDKLLKEVAPAPLTQRQHAIYHCDRMLRLSMGENPIAE